MLRRTLVPSCLLLAATAGALNALSWASPPSADEPREATYEQVKEWVRAYKAAHPGRGGKDWDVNSKSAEQIAAEPDTKRLLSVCGPNQRPVIPMLAWEYGGSDHRWQNPEDAALVYCVCTPVKKATSSWSYDRSRDRVTSDIYVKFPDQNPCKDETGKDQVMKCIGDPTNLEILVDTASLGDGRNVGLNLSEAETELRLVLPNGKKVRLALAQ
jgi:hypothetical protein